MARARANASSAAANRWFMFMPLSAIHRDLAVHSRFEMARNEACKVEVARPGEAPYEGAGLAWLDGHGVRIIVLHLRKLLHECRMLLELLQRAQHHFVLQSPVVF